MDFEQSLKDSTPGHYLAKNWPEACRFLDQRFRGGPLPHLGRLSCCWELAGGRLKAVFGERQYILPGQSLVPLFPALTSPLHFSSSSENSWSSLLFQLWVIFKEKHKLGASANLFVLKQSRARVQSNRRLSKPRACRHRQRDMWSGRGLMASGAATWSSLLGIYL